MGNGGKGVAVRCKMERKVLDAGLQGEGLRSTTGLFEVKERMQRNRSVGGKSEEEGARATASGIV